MASTGRHRIFIAVTLAPALHGQIVEIEHRLETAGARVRWIPPANLHFTLRFLGEISPAQVAAVRLATREAAAHATPFRLTLHGIGAFPSAQRPQVIWVGVRAGAEELAVLSRALDDALARQRFPREDRPFVAHLTLSRVRNGRRWGDLVRAIAQFRDTSVGEQDITTITVMESHPQPRGAHYTPVEEVPLGHILNSPS